jgi:hypothetical protein
VDTALFLFLEHPELFRRIQHLSLQTSQGRDSALYCGRSNAQISWIFSPKGRRMRDVKRRLSAFFASNNCTGFCEIKVVEQDDHIGFVIIHGSPPKTYGTILNRHERSRSSQRARGPRLGAVPQGTPASSRCRLARQRSATPTAWCFGIDLLRLPASFPDQERGVTGPALLTLGAQALETEHFLSLRRVTLRQLQVAERNGRGTRWSVEAPDLASRLEEHDIQQLMSRGQLADGPNGCAPVRPEAGRAGAA